MAGRPDLSISQVGRSRAFALPWRFGLLWRRPLRRNPVCRRQRGARPRDELVGLVEQSLRYTPECEIYRFALLRVIERRKRLGFPERLPALVIHPKVEAVLRHHA